MKEPQAASSIVQEANDGRPPLRWADILQRKFVVIFGEANTGKTSEFRGVAKKLQASGKHAFFLPVESVATAGVSQSLQFDDVLPFERWRASSEDAVLLLDSVDEALLKGLTLSTALRKCMSELGADLQRTRLILSCRASDWRFLNQDTIEQFLRANGCVGEEGKPSYVCLAPLDEGQIAALAMNFEVTDCDAFLAAVRDANAWSFLERPGDVRWLCEYWNENHRIGRLANLVDFSVELRLAEKHSRPTHISEVRAREGACILALVCVLTQRTEIAIPDESRRDADFGPLGPHIVLPDWSNVEIDDLLSRGIFDEATYGRVRFHHRMVTEYLAAYRLFKMGELGLSVEDRNALLLRKTSRGLKVPRHLASVAAWLAIWDPAWRRELARTAPETLMDEGDPSSLPAGERVEILKRYFERFGDREEVYFDLSSQGLRRFACPEMIDTLRTVMNLERPANHLLTTSLKLVEKGKIRALLHEATELAACTTVASSVRVDAIRVVARLGTPQQRQDLFVVIDDPVSPDRELATILVGELFPDVLSIAQLVHLLLTLSVSPSHHVSNLDVLLPKLVARLTVTQQNELLERLISGLMEVGHSERTVESGQHLGRVAWLGELLVQLMTTALKADCIPIGLVERGLELLTETIQGIGFTNSTRFVRAIDESPVVRQHMFWKRVASYVAKGGPYPTQFWDVNGISDIWAFGGKECDIDWLSRDCSSLQDVKARLLAFNCLRTVLTQSAQSVSDPDAYLDDIANRSDTLNACTILRKRLGRIRNPPSIDVPDWVGKHRRLHMLHAVQKQRLQEYNTSELRSRIDGIQSSDDFSALHFLHERYGHRDSNDKVHNVRTRIAEEFGPEVASAFLAGVGAFWRRFDPEGPESFPVSSFPHYGPMGILGIEHQIEQGLRFDDLPKDLRRKAAVFSTWQLNEIPNWIATVADVESSVVWEVFKPSIRLDFEEQSSVQGQPLGRLLWKLAHAPVAARKACANGVLELILQDEPKCSDRLKDALDVATVDESAREQLLDLAERRISEPGYSEAKTIVWLRLVLQMRPSQFAELFERSTNRVKNPQAFVEAAFGEFLRESERAPNALFEPLKTNIESLSRLTMAGYKYLRPGEDEEHAGVYSPGNRDYAQRLRGYLLGWLSEIPGERTVEALTALAAMSEAGRHHDWLVHLADLKALDNSSSIALDLPAAVRFARERVRTILTANDLHDVAALRLRDIQYEVSHDDFSYRELFSPADKPIAESVAQKFIASRLEAFRRGQYDVGREQEVVDLKRTDIRLASPRCAGPVTIEVKVAEQWSYSQLVAALRDQLVGLYMRANNSRYGILLLCSSGPSRTWIDQSRTRLGNLEDLAEALRREAENILRVNPGVSKLDVATLDFHEHLIPSRLSDGLA